MKTGTKNELITWLLSQKDNIKFEIKEFKEKRSLNQNSYYWQLINKLSFKIRIPSEEIHIELLRKFSTRYEILVPNKTKLRGISYYDKLSSIKKGNAIFDTYRVYTPSHELNTIEMGLLLDGLIEECRTQGIETMTPDEIAKMRSLENE